MLHVRVVSPPHRTSALIDALERQYGVTNLMILPGVSRRPQGDMIQFDVTAGDASQVMQLVRGLGLVRYGTVAMESIDAAISDPDDGAATHQGRWRELEPVWEMVDASIRAGATYPPSFFVLLVIAGLIAAVGILTNSQILIVGAMVVGPEYGAIIGAALGISHRDWRTVGRAGLALVIGFVAAIIVTLVFSIVVRNSVAVPKAFLLGVRPVSSLINTPNAFSVVVAVLAGIVGVVSLTEARSAAMIGVFISVTTVPAAADIAVSLAFQSWSEAAGSTVQLLLNVILLIVVGTTALSVQRRIWRGHSRAPGSEG